MTQDGKMKFTKFSKLFRSKSEQRIVSKPGPKKTAATATPTKRRFLRVVRDNEHEGEEFENQHIIRRYTQDYWSKQMEEARRLQHATSLPYDVNSDHTILKKSHSADSDTEGCSECATSSPSLVMKKASFKEQVQVFEFYGSESIKKKAFQLLETKLVDSEDESSSGVVTSSCDDELAFRSTACIARKNEYKLAKQLSFDDENDDGCVTSESCETDTSLAQDSNNSTELESIGARCDAMTSDSGAMSDTSNCSDICEPKPKSRKKRLRLRVGFLESSSNDSDKENDTTQTTVTSSTHARKYPKALTRLLRGIHLQRDSRDSDNSECSL